jgi:hypothetical protein
MGIGKRGVPTFLAAIVSVFLFSISWSLTSVYKASAHTVGTFYGKSWSSDPNYYIGFLAPGFSTASGLASINSAPSKYNSLANSTLDFNPAGTDGTVAWMGDVCATLQNEFSGVWVISYDFGNAGVPGLTSDCNTGTSNFNKMVVGINQNSGLIWYTGSGDSPSTDVDLRSVVTHEFGHATGFGLYSASVHFDGAAAICSGATKQTMCPSTVFGEDVMRSLETHDKHTVEGKY